ncbi:MAG: acylphosphatase [Ekhidna sp.]
MIARRIQAYGRVQGVFYRASARDKAIELNISGWMKNEPDGSVLIEAEGLAENMEVFTSWCSEGPIMAKVDRLSMEDIPLLNSQGFTIRH